MNNFPNGFSEGFEHLVGLIVVFSAVAVVVFQKHRFLHIGKFISKYSLRYPS